MSSKRAIKKRYAIFKKRLQEKRKKKNFSQSLAKFIRNRGRATINQAKKMGYLKNERKNGHTGEEES